MRCGSGLYRVKHLEINCSFESQLRIVACDGLVYVLCNFTYVLFKVWLYVRLGTKTFEIAMSSSEFMGRESKMTSISDNVLSLDVLSCLF